MLLVEKETFSTATINPDYDLVVILFPAYPRRQGVIKHTGVPGLGRHTRAHARARAQISPYEAKNKD